MSSSLSPAAQAVLAKNLKVVVIGDGAVGKTSLLISYTTQSFPTEYVPTVFENFNAVQPYLDRNVNMNLWDTAGQEEYDKLRPLSYPNTDALIICYSVDCKPSYVNIKDKWIKEVREAAPNSPFILVATKTDLRDDPKAIAELKKTGQTFLTREQGEELKEAIGAKVYMECSAKSRVGVEEVFETAVRVIVEEVERLSAPQKSKSSSSTSSTSSSTTTEPEKKKKKHRFRRWLNK